MFFIIYKEVIKEQATKSAGESYYRAMLPVIS